MSSINTNRSKIFFFLVALVLVLCTAMTGMLFLPGSWYISLYKPWWTPPSIVFPVVWTILYIIDIGVGSWVLVRGDAVLKGLWLMQLLFNGGWSYLVFGRHQLLFGLVDIILLWISLILFLMNVFHKKKVIFILFLPYVLWVTVALLLNFNLWQLN
ncbi:MAG: hypothetical protein B7Z65_08600 [Ferrovum sp. 21-44-67]|uniref:TspO/MBR family protein n=1 Tax=Ferrovum sp. JA12 TaxID=1356299 RepID=UPI00071478BA|nr:TspO/MBR family protein [Ferrovum sp. JA12]KRH79936.1 TspO/MBR family protein [Ferrovum sp. JA12]OYV78851.1 MAG: hypothetical protein B7Z65_08600 [Ferrovum sp. 21-44-67]HQT82203.1 tryptophan-rich sensory protein [Ferrovaceae bacterium]HQU07286.1 tryptophan-rich sensory protein [Ferrovaceae bacterium]